MKINRFITLCCVNILFLAIVAIYNPISVYTKCSTDTYDLHNREEAQTRRVTNNCEDASTSTQAGLLKSQTITINEKASSPTAECATQNSTLFLTTIFTSRLGNHMFIYAMLLGVARAQGRRPFIHDGIDLSGTFQISLVDPRIDTKGWSVMHSSQHTKFESRFMQLPETNIILDGSFQSWKYFQHIQSEVRREFTLTTVVQKQVMSILAPHRSKLLNNALVGVHVRRGDFLDPYNVKLGFSVPNVTYFENAFARMRSLLAKKNVTFLVGSDDIQWCRENLRGDGVSILPQNGPGIDLAVLANCDHMIISGGTFGWWAAWLANGITIYYSNYILPNTRLSQGYDKDDYYIPGWIGLNNTSS